MWLAHRMDVGHFTPVEETALLTEYARALDSRAPRPILGDALADEVVGEINYDFAGLGVISSVVCLVALRARMLDDRIRAFITEHSDAVVVDLGAGLNSAVFRVDPPPTVDWYSVDLPAVIRLRDSLLPSRDGSHSVEASVAEPDWTDAIPGDRPTMVVADGLFPFLSEPVIVAIFRQITDHFVSGMVAFNDYGAVGRIKRFASVVTTRKRMFRTLYSQWRFGGFKDAHRPETWSPCLKLVEEASALHEPDVALFPPMLRFGSRIAGRLPASARNTRILRYQF
jgi:O-methyltransferase involved in polyketide biosynthesis